jgi:hypothetical protein
MHLVEEAGYGQRLAHAQVLGAVNKSVLKATSVPQFGQRNRPFLSSSGPVTRPANWHRGQAWTVVVSPNTGLAG